MRASMFFSMMEAWKGLPYPGFEQKSPAASYCQLQPPLFFTFCDVYHHCQAMSEFCVEPLVSNHLIIRKTVFKCSSCPLFQQSGHKKMRDPYISCLKDGLGSPKRRLGRRLAQHLIDFFHQIARANKKKGFHTSRPPKNQRIRGIIILRSKELRSPLKNSKSE